MIDGSLFVLALIVRYVTGRFLHEYDPTLGKSYQFYLICFLPVSIDYCFIHWNYFASQWVMIFHMNTTCINRIVTL